MQDKLPFGRPRAAARPPDDYLWYVLNSTVTLPDRSTPRGRAACDFIELLLADNEGPDGRLPHERGR